MEALGGIAAVLLVFGGLILLVLGILMPIFVYMAQRFAGQAAAEARTGNQLLREALKELRALNEEHRGHGSMLAKIGSGSTSPDRR